MDQLKELVDRRQEYDRDTTIVVRGNPEHDHVRTVVDQLTAALATDRHVLEREDIERVEPVFKEMGEGETLVLYLGKIHDQHPEILDRVVACKHVTRWKPLTWIFVTHDAPGRAIEHYSDIEVVPKLTAEVNRLQQNAYDGEVYRQRMADVVVPGEE